MTDEQLAAEIREAAAVVMARADQLAAGGAWSVAANDKATHATLRAAGKQLAALPSDAAAVDVRAAVAPMLGLFWPTSPAAMRPTHDAIENCDRSRCTGDRKYAAPDGSQHSAGQLIHRLVEQSLSQ